MKTSAALLSLGLLFGISAPALAAATPEEAQRLTALFQTYLGGAPGMVSVTPAGESYAATFDFQPSLSKLAPPEFAASITPFEMTLSPQGNGKWKVDQDQPFSVSLKAEGRVNVMLAIGSLKGSGIFDEALGVFSSSEAEYRNIAFDQTFIEQNQTARSTYTLQSVTVTSTAAAGPDGVDIKQMQAYQNFRQTVSVPAAANGSAPGMDFTMASPSGTQDVAITGMRLRPVMDLVAWAVAHPTAETIKTGQAELKDKLRAALPLFSSISGTAKMDQPNVNSIAGSFTAQKMDFAAEMNGVVADGKLREAITVTGFKMPAKLVPQWAAGLVPSNFKIDLNVSGFNLAKPAAMIIDKFDLANNPPLPAGFENELIPALMPTGSVAIGLGPSEILAALYHLTAEGSMTAGPASQPQGSAVLKLKGLDETSAALQAAPPEFGMAQMMPVILLAKGLAKQEADGYLAWTIETTPQGSVTINGNDLSKMTGGQ
jgi:hypothetical protein